MSDGVYSIDAAIHASPSPALVAQVVDSHGAEAAQERWHWLGERTISTLAQRGRAQKGDVSPRRTGGRGLSCSELDAGAAIESGYVLDSAQRGIRAAGVSVGAQGLYSRRGLTPPTISSTERGIATSLGARARRGDAEAAAEWEARLSFERAVGAVVRRALALVPEQPPAGRYVLPPVNAALAEALRDEDPAAVTLVFPGLAELEPAPSEPEPPVAEPPSIPETRKMRRQSRVPTDDVLLAERAQGRSVEQMAYDWETKPATIRAALRRIDEAAQAEAPPPEPLPAPRPEPAHRLAAVPVPVPPSGRLSANDLAIAVALAQRAQITPDEAVAYVRADVSQARGQPYVPAPSTAGFSASRMPPKLEAWFQALVDGDDLPGLEMEDLNHV